TRAGGPKRSGPRATWPSRSRSTRSSPLWSGTPQEGTDQGAGRQSAERRRTYDLELTLEREPRWREHDHLGCPVADRHDVRDDPRRSRASPQVWAEHGDGRRRFEKVPD